MDSKIDREKDIFDQALALPSIEARLAYLREACGGDQALGAHLEALLEAHAAAVGFIPFKPVGDETLMSSQTEEPGAVIGHYKLLQKIGEGGCGVVFMAEQEQPVRRRVALKVIKLGMDTRQVVARFEAERQALALMDHPNIAKVLEAGATEAGRPYFVMELVRGNKITEFCDQKNLSTRERLKLFIQVCQAIQHAHQKGIIHRDIKPSNILVTVNDGAGLPKVIDFGIAKATAGQKLTDRTLFTAFEQFMGTPAYMSPEQAEMTSVDIDTRTDIYSLGVLLYELLTGKTPFDAKELLEAGVDALRRTLREMDPIRPSTRLSRMLEVELTTIALRRASEAPKLVHLVRGDLDWIVMKALEKDRSRRYETANGLAADIQRHLNQEPVTARPTSDLYRLQKLIRRHKLAVAAASAVLLSLVLGIGATTWQAVRATRLGERAAAGDRESRHLLYVANMNLAEQAWEENNVGRLRMLLKKTALRSDLGFEWYYWQRQTHLALRTLRGHDSWITSLAFSPDGKRIITGSDDHTAKVWDATSGDQLFTLNGPSEAIASLAYSPDGRRIITTYDDHHTALIWEAATGKKLLTLNHPRTFRSVAFSPDSQRIVAGFWDKTAKVWDVPSGKELLTLTGHVDNVNAVAFSPNGHRIVTGSRDATAKVWDADSGKQLLTLTGHVDSISSVAFSPDGQRIVTGSGTPGVSEVGKDQTAKVWDATTGDALFTLTGHGGQINSVAFSPDGQWIVTGSHDQTARVWSAATGKQVCIIRGHSDLILAVAFSPNSQWIATGSYDRTVKLWALPVNKEPLTLQGHNEAVSSLTFSSDGQRIVTSSWDQTAKVWSVPDGQLLSTLKGHTGKVDSAAFSPDGQRIATGGADKSIKVWEAATGKEQLTLTGHNDRVLSVDFSTNGQRILSGSMDHTAKVWELASRRPSLTLTGHQDMILCARFSPNGQRIVTASGGADRTARIWDSISGHEVHRFQGHNDGIWCVAFSPDGKCIVTGGADRTAILWDADNGQELRRFAGHGDMVMAIGFSPDGQRIVTGCMDGTAKVWETGTGQELLTLKGHSAQVRGVAFSPDGSRIATGGWDKTIKLWQAATPQQVATWQTQEATEGHHPP